MDHSSGEPSPVERAELRSVIVFGSIAVLILERAPGGNIRHADDALWWAFVTVTTVGYGDHYPVTGAGRVLAVLLMITGIALFGTFTAYVASAFAAREESGHDAEIAGLRRDIRALAAVLERTLGEERAVSLGGTAGTDVARQSSDTSSDGAPKLLEPATNRPAERR